MALEYTGNFKKEVLGNEIISRCKEVGRKISRTEAKKLASVLYYAYENRNPSSDTTLNLNSIEYLYQQAAEVFRYIIWYGFQYHESGLQYHLFHWRQNWTKYNPGIEDQPMYLDGSRSTSYDEYGINFSGADLARNVYEEATRRNLKPNMLKVLCEIFFKLSKGESKKQVDERLNDILVCTCGSEKHYSVLMERWCLKCRKYRIMPMLSDKESYSDLAERIMNLGNTEFNNLQRQNETHHSQACPVCIPLFDCIVLRHLCKAKTHKKAIELVEAYIEPRDNTFDIDSTKDFFQSRSTLVIKEFKKIFPSK